MVPIFSGPSCKRYLKNIGEYVIDTKYKLIMTKEGDSLFLGLKREI